MKIVNCNIENPKYWGDTAKVNVTYEDGTSQLLFEFFVGEITFIESEFIGLTSEEADKLHEKRIENTLLNRMN